MKRSQLILALIIIFLMVSSVIGFVYTNPNSNESSINYNDFKFVLDTNERYQVNVNDRVFVFDYLPNELNDISLPEFSLGSDKYYLLYDPAEKDDNMDYSMNKLGYTLNLLDIRPVPACISEKDCPQELPVKDCTTNSFYIKKSDVSKVYLDDKCIVVEGKEEGLNKAIDKINLKIAGII